MLPCVISKSSREHKANRFYVGRRGIVLVSSPCGCNISYLLSEICICAVWYFEAKNGICVLAKQVLAQYFWLLTFYRRFDLSMDNYICNFFGCNAIIQCIDRPCRHASPWPTFCLQNIQATFQPGKVWHAIVMPPHLVSPMLDTGMILSN